MGWEWKVEGMQGREQDMHKEGKVAHTLTGVVV